MLHVAGDMGFIYIYFFCPGGDYKLFERLYVRHWDVWVEKRNQPFAVSLSYSANKVQRPF